MLVVLHHPSPNSVRPWVFPPAGWYRPGILLDISSNYFWKPPLLAHKRP